MGNRVLRVHASQSRQLLGMLANGDTIEELLEEYPSLTREDILACLDYAASLAEEQVTPQGIGPMEYTSPSIQEVPHASQYAAV